jgi:hypothetical protein
MWSFTFSKWFISPKTMFSVSSRCGNRSGTYFYHKWNQPSLCLDCLYKRSIHLIEPSPSLHPKFHCDKVCDNSCNEISDELCDHPPFPSDLFHHKLCSLSIKFVHLNQPPIALSIETSIINMMQSFYDEPVRSTELFTKPANFPIEMSMHLDPIRYHRCSSRACFKI